VEKESAREFRVKMRREMGGAKGHSGRPLEKSTSPGQERKKGRRLKNKFKGTG